VPREAGEEDEEEEHPLDVVAKRRAKALDAQTVLEDGRGQVAEEREDDDAGQEDLRGDTVGGQWLKLEAGRGQKAGPHLEGLEVEVVEHGLVDADEDPVEGADRTSDRAEMSGRLRVGETDERPLLTR
jgi:hypothetical protein